MTKRKYLDRRTDIRKRKKKRTSTHNKQESISVDSGPSTSTASEPITLPLRQETVTTDPTSISSPYTACRMSVDNTTAPKTEEVANVEYTTPSFDIHTFVATICDMDVQFQIFKMDSSLLVWIGSLAEPTFQDLTLAMKTCYDALPLTTKLLGDSVDMISSNLASKLVKRLGKPVYVSFNLPMDRLLLPGIEQRLIEEIQLYPDKFN